MPVSHNKAKASFAWFCEIDFGPPTFSSWFGPPFWSSHHGSNGRWSRRPGLTLLLLMLTLDFGKKLNIYNVHTHYVVICVGFFSLNIKSFLAFLLLLLSAKKHGEWISYDVQFHQYQAWLSSANSHVVGLYKWKVSCAIITKLTKGCKFLMHKIPPFDQDRRCLFYCEK